MISVKDRVSSSGKMEGSMMECGRMGSSMGREHSQLKMASRGSANGTEAGSPSGSHDDDDDDEFIYLQIRLALYYT